MGCASPLTGYRSNTVGASGKRGITFSRTAAYSPVPIKLPCGQCMGCRLEHSRQWAMRGVHELKFHDRSCFLTLTYDNVHLPRGGTLVRRDPQLFLKRLRDKHGKFRYYGCGEYGEQFGRPHYHLILFGMDFPDKKFWGKSRSGDDLYVSEAVSALWPYGANKIGAVTFDSIAYVARYVTTKLNGPKCVEYDMIMPDGEVIRRLPEFPMVSRRPGLGYQWFEKYGKHAYEWDSVIMNGREVRPPRFYDGKFEVLDPDLLLMLKRKRRRKALLATKNDNSSRRRQVKDEVLRRNLMKRDQV